MFGWLICKLTGKHKWRRVGKRDIAHGSLAIPLREMIATGANLRLCKRCGATSLIKPRKPKVTA